MKKKKHARWRWYEILLVGALLGLAVCSTAWLTSYWGQMRAAQQTFEKLAQAVRAAAPQPEEERGEVWQKGVETLQAQNRDCPGLAVQCGYGAGLSRDVYAAAAGILSAQRF